MAGSEDSGACTKTSTAAIVHGMFCLEIVPNSERNANVLHPGIVFA